MTRSGIVLARKGSQFQIHTAEGEVTAVLRGRVKRGDGRAIVGDRVTLEDLGSGWAITSVEPRTNVLERRIPGGRGSRPMAANLDRVLVMTATTNPDPVPQLLDRLLVLAEADDIPASVIVNKIDLDPGTALITRMEQAGYPVLAISVAKRLGLAPLIALMRSGVSLVTGPSGAGKSSLLNLLQPGLGLLTGKVSGKDGRGTHTTVSAIMIPMDEGGYLVDTPGLSDVGFWGLDPVNLVQCFPDLLRCADECRFPDCSHRSEPGCAVREQVGIGIAEDRYASYCLFREELDSEPRDWE